MTDQQGPQIPPQVVTIPGQRQNEETTLIGQILAKLSDIDKQEDKILKAIADLQKGQTRILQALDELDKPVVSSKAIAEENRDNIGTMNNKLPDIDKALDELDTSVVSSKAIAEENRINIGTMNNKLSHVIKAICIVGGSACAVYLLIVVARKSYSSLIRQLIEEIKSSELPRVQSTYIIGKLTEIVESPGQPSKIPGPF